MNFDEINEEIILAVSLKFGVGAEISLKQRLKSQL